MNQSRLKQYTLSIVCKKSVICPNLKQCYRKNENIKPSTISQFHDFDNVLTKKANLMKMTVHLITRLPHSGKSARMISCHTDTTSFMLKESLGCTDLFSNSTHTLLAMSKEYIGTELGIPLLWGYHICIHCLKCSPLCFISKIYILSGLFEYADILITCTSDLQLANLRKTIWTPHQQAWTGCHERWYISFTSIKMLLIHLTMCCLVWPRTPIVLYWMNMASRNCIERLFDGTQLCQWIRFVVKHSYFIKVYGFVS